MAEKTLALQLAGNEVIEAILDTLRERMRRDCYLNPNSAYDYFSAKITVSLDLHDMGNVKTEHTVSVSNGTPSEEGEKIEAEFNMEPAPPNEIRVQTGQPVPVQTQDKEGKTAIKHVRYSRKDAKKVGAVTAILLALLLAPALRAQAGPAPTKPAVVKPAETLDTTERLARQSIYDKQQSAMAEGRAFAADVAKHHPGYHYDDKTGDLAKDEKVEAKK